jgi:hypothetical protein
VGATQKRREAANAENINKKCWPEIPSGVVKPTEITNLYANKQKQKNSTA